MRTIDTDSVSNDATTLSNKIEEVSTEMTKLNISIDENKEGFQGERGNVLLKRIRMVFKVKEEMFFLKY